MPEEEPIVVLEKQVHRLLEAVRRLKEDNVQLQARMRHIGQQLAKKQNEATRWAHDRSRVEAKVRKLLTELDARDKSDGRD